MALSLPALSLTSCENLVMYLNCSMSSFLIGKSVLHFRLLTGLNTCKPETMPNTDFVPSEFYLHKKCYFAMKKKG